MSLYSRAGKRRWFKRPQREKGTGGVDVALYII